MGFAVLYPSYTVTARLRHGYGTVTATPSCRRMGRAQRNPSVQAEVTQKASVQPRIRHARRSQNIDRSRSRGKQRGGARIGRGARRHHVIDEQDPLPAHLRRPRPPYRERTRDLRCTLGGRLLAERCRGALAHQRIGQGGPPRDPPHRLGQQRRLVVTASEQPPAAAAPAPAGPPLAAAPRPRAPCAAPTPQTARSDRHA
jgi:hypothetical protein